MQEMKQNKRQVGQEWEDLVLEYYEENWYEILDTNYTIRWWEIDIIAQKDWEIVFVEVKVVDGMDDVMWYITPKKLMFLENMEKINWVFYNVYIYPEINLI